MLNKQEIKKRKDTLDSIAKTLKNKFYGIDQQIDAIVSSISSWYICPDIITRPVIVNLWGLTGVGKTSVVRELVALLGMNGKYLELQLNGGEKKSMNEILLTSNIEVGEPGIILLDEFQRFKSVNESGSEDHTSGISDLWMLLSDGRFSFDEIITRIIYVYEKLRFEMKSKEYDINNSSDRFEDESDRIKFIEGRNKLNYLKGFYNRNDATSYGGISFNNNTGLIQVRRYVYDNMDPEEFLELETAKVVEDIEKFINSAEARYLDYTKCLIFISGNLDEAYNIASDVSDCDTDADVFHEYTKKITVLKIKNALTARFKPEQIARLGNDHVIYPSLNRATYEKLIRENCGEYIRNFEKLTNIKIEIDPILYKVIYDNSVFPTQGTRPVFSTIQKVFTSPLSKGLMWGMENEISSLVVSVDSVKSVLKFLNNDKEFEVPIVLDIDNSRKKYSEDFSALIAVHEAGHAIIYSELFKHAPKEIKINVASFTGGYNMFDSPPMNCKKSILNDIATSLGGIVAEELIFGDENRSDGCGSDIINATSKASSYVRSWAMNGNVARIDSKSMGCSFVENTEESDKHIETILNDQKKRAKDIIIKHRSVLIELSKYLLTNKKIERKDYIEKYGSIFKLEDKEVDVFVNYKEILFNS